MPSMFEGEKVALNVTGSVLVVSGPCRLVRVIITQVSTQGSAIYDNTAASGNILLNIPANAAMGSIFDVDEPVEQGIYFLGGASAYVNIVWSEGPS